MAPDVVQTGPREASKPRTFLPLGCSLGSPAVCCRKVRYELRLNQISTGLTNMLHTLSVTWVNRLGEVAEGALLDQETMDSHSKTHPFPVKQ